ncbi:MAG TPA: formyltetrahydrofolate deformylase [Chloroflexota bacterium]|nr:formyltetrahydrofolate deformylase [Chloroflexota bacterium]
MPRRPRETTCLTDRGRLLISCPDRPGIIAAVSRFLFENGANIVDSNQHSTAPVGGLFFMRIEFDLPDLAAHRGELERAFVPIARRFAMDWRVRYAAERHRLAVFVSRDEHCLLELLWQVRSGDLHADIARVVSNHADLADVVTAWNIPFHHVPVEPDGKWEAEREQLALLETGTDTIVLARYMQILSPHFVARWRGKIINIHHGFLPAFAGARPYDQAFARGVKLIGATAHYVTEELDAGPIIEQDVERVDHGDTPDDLRRIGRSIERQVLARAVAWHVDDRIVLHENKTVVFR